jgi:hypothetical protein
MSADQQVALRRKLILMGKDMAIEATEKLNVLAKQDYTSMQQLRDAE